MVRSTVATLTCATSAIAACLYQGDDLDARLLAQHGLKTGPIEVVRCHEQYRLRPHLSRLSYSSWGNACRVEGSAALPYL